MANDRDIVWRLALNSPPGRVYGFIASDDGRARFWAERAERRGDMITFSFPNRWSQPCRVLAEAGPHRFELDYFGSPTCFDLQADGSGTRLTLTARNIPPADYEDVLAGWVSVLLALKAACDHGVDLRNHDPARSWDQRFCDN